MLGSGLIRVLPRCACIIVAALICSAADAKVKPATVFSDNMVLQRDANLPVWGTASQGTTVRVVLARQEKSTKTDKKGNWKVEFDAMPAGGPHELSIESDTSVTLHNIMIGDVWLCSGQSNMDFATSRAVPPIREAGQTDNANLRLFKVPRKIGLVPEREMSPAKWNVCTSGTAASFSAVAYGFGMNLQDHLNIPIGLIQASWGGTGAQCWTSMESLATLDKYRDTVRGLRNAGADPEKNNRWFDSQMSDWVDVMNSKDAGMPEWSRDEITTSGWESFDSPANDGRGRFRLRGIVWLRKQFDTGELNVSSTATLRLGTLGGFDTVWINGKKIAETTTEPQKARQYVIPAGVLRKGSNTVAVRLLSVSQRSGLGGGKEVLAVSIGRKKIPLEGTWFYRFGADYSSLPEPPPDPFGVFRPASLYNGMISPLLPLPIKGVIWYQGENNAPHAADYRTLFPKLINDWRTTWHSNLPFLFVQLPNYNAYISGQGDDTWAELREAQLITFLQTPKTGMAITMDLGNPDDVHPRNKRPVADRLTLAARHVAYGEDLVWCGPVYRRDSTKLRGNAIEGAFDQTGSGLLFRGEKAEGFQLAGPDKVYHAADAKIEGDRVIVSSPAVAKAQSMRYGWANNPTCNLFNKEGLPASPFRTDNFPMVTGSASDGHR